MKKSLHFILPALLSFTLATCQGPSISSTEESNNETGDIGKNAPESETNSEDDVKKVVAEYNFTSSGWATFGIVLPKGKAFNGLKVGELVTQNDIKNRWSDGSIRYAILTTRIQSAGVYEIYESNIQAGSFMPTIPTAELTLDIEGSGIHKSVLSNNVSADLWLNGPLAVEWRVRDIPQNNDAKKHPFLSNTWDIRVYNDGTGTVDAIVENVRDVATADGVVYSAEIRVNGAIVFQHAAKRKGPNTLTWASDNTYASVNHGLVNGNCIRFTSGPKIGAVVHIGGRSSNTANSFSISDTFSDRQSIVDAGWEQIFYHSYGVNWRKTFDLSGFERAEFKTDFKPFIDANAIPEYMSNVNSNTELMRGNGEWEGMAPLGFSNLATYTAAVGGRAEIGPYPRWQAQFIVHQTSELRDQLISMANLAGSFSAHFTKSDPSRVVTVDDNPNYWLDRRAVAGNKPLNNMVGRMFGYENAHAASLAYIPYLVTGDRYYSDEMLHYANFAIMHTNPSSSYTTDGKYRNGKQGLLWRNEVRGLAWGFRNVVDAANYLPDDSYYSQYFRRIVGSNLKDFDRYARDMQLITPLGFMALSTGVDGEYMYTYFWQKAFLAWAVQHAVEQRDVSESEASEGVFFRDRLFKLLFEPAIIETGFPPEYLTGAHTRYGIRINGVIKLFQTWKEVYEANHVTNGVPGPIPSWGYGAEMRPALIAAKKAGYPGIQKAYDFFMNPATHSISYYRNLPGNAQYAFADVN